MSSLGCLLRQSGLYSINKNATPCANLAQAWKRALELVINLIHNGRTDFEELCNWSFFSCHVQEMCIYWLASPVRRPKLSGRTLCFTNQFIAIPMVVTLLLQATLIYAFSWICWNAFRQLFVKSALDNIPGPPAKSLWKGDDRHHPDIFNQNQYQHLMHICTGVFPQVFNTNAWDFHREIAEKCMYHYLCAMYRNQKFPIRWQRYQNQGYARRLFQ